MTDFPRSLGDERTQAGSPPEPPLVARSLGDQSTHAEGISSVSELGVLAANLDETLELTDLAARYEIGEVIGRGGMGEVLLARDKRLERSVAIKRILGEGARSAMALRRFLTEARSLAQLNHFNIVQVHDYGRDAQGPFLILEYVAGKSLQDRLKEGPLPVEQAVELSCQLCDGLGAAHERGIIHRDVKPANVLLTERGEPKLTDFGLAHRESGDDGRTQAGAVLGTIDFMPPEQRRDATQADARSDLWSLAATLYQMLTGKSPKVIRLDQVPESLRTVLGKALEENPADRYATATELKEGLRNAAEQLRKAAGLSKQRDLVEGVCLQCGTENDQSRKFCKACRAALTVECLNCKTPTKVWEDVCGECGISQQEETAQIRAACERQLEEADSLGREYRFEEALQLCAAVRNEKPAFLTVLKERAEQLTKDLQARRREQVRLAAALFADARKHFDTARYEAALTELAKIPEPLCDAAAQALRTEARKRVIELASLLTEIKRRVAAKQLDKLDKLTARALELQPQQPQVAKLHQQLAEQTRKAEAREWERERQSTIRAEEARKKEIELAEVSRRAHAAHAKGKLKEAIRLARSHAGLSGFVELWQREAFRKNLPRYAALAMIAISVIGVALYVYVQIQIEYNRRVEAAQLMDASEVFPFSSGEVHFGVSIKDKDFFPILDYSSQERPYRFTLVGKSPPGLQIDPNRGAVSWPKAATAAPGTYRVRIAVQFQKEPECDNEKEFVIKIPKLNSSQSPTDTPVSPARPSPISSVPVAPSVSTVVTVATGTPPPMAAAPFDEAAARKHQKAWAEYLGAPVEVTNEVGMKLTLIPAGEFLMGSPKDDPDAAADENPQHQVTITKPFYMGSTEVTQGQWKAVMGTSPWSGQAGVKDDQDSPATYVSWKDATEFCQKLSEKEGKTYRLPTEAEWEYACRAGTTTKYHFGNDESRLGDYAWYSKNTYQLGEKYAHAVGQKKPNGWGLYDMQGNVFEWCSDWYFGEYYGQSPVIDPSGPATGDLRIFRGSCWAAAPAFCRLADREGNSLNNRRDFVGFRVAIIP